MHAKHSVFLFTFIYNLSIYILYNHFHFDVIYLYILTFETIRWTWSLVDKQELSAANIYYTHELSIFHVRHQLYSSIHLIVTIHQQRKANYPGCCLSYFIMASIDSCIKRCRSTTLIFECSSSMTWHLFRWFR